MASGKDENLAEFYLEQNSWDVETAFSNYNEDMKFEKECEIALSKFNREYFLQNKNQDKFLQSFTVNHFYFAFKVLKQIYGG